MKCFQRHKWIRKQAYFADFQTYISYLPSKTEGGIWKIESHFWGSSSNLVVSFLLLIESNSVLGSVSSRL